MKKLTFILLLIIFSVSFSGAQQLSILDNPEISANIRLFEKWVESQMEYYNLPGLSMGIVYDQTLVWKKGFGYADVEKKVPMTPGTIFRLASITKLFTSTAIMQLRDAGKLRLDDPIEKHLPWFKIKNRFPDEPPITIWQILTHTSGLPREAAFPYWTDHKFPTMEQIRKALPNQETIFPPETKWKYSNLAMALLGEIVVAVSGEKYDHCIVNHILKPLAMNNTSVFLTDEQLKTLATGYGIRLPDGRREVMPFTDSKGLTPAANMSSNIEDMAKFIMLQFRESNTVSEKQILKGGTLREMHRVHWLRPNWKSGWGLGFSIRQYGSRTLVGHGGWVGGYRSQIYFCPDEKIGVVVFSNAEDGSPSKFARKIFDMIVPAILKAVKPAAEKPEFNPQWEKFVGKYEDPWHWVTEIMILNNQLVMYGFNYPPNDDPEGSLVELTPEGKNTFRMAGENGNGELVVFELGEDGRVKRVKTGENYLFPVRKQ